jgi:hypothetical protein
MTMSGGAVAQVVGPQTISMSRIAVAPTTPSYAWTFSDGCTYSATTGRFTCPAVTSGGLTLNRDYAFFDANNQPQSAYDAATTDSANFHVSVVGTITFSNGQANVNRDRNFTVSGLLGAETSRTWNGTGSRNDNGSRNGTDGTVRSYQTADALTVSQVVVDLPRSTYPWPMSGTITRHITGTASVSRNGVTKSFSVDRTVTITFNGSQTATVTVNGNTYTLDLSTGVATKS